MKRLLRVVFVLLFLTLGVAAFTYNGVWYNTNSNTNGITKIVVKSNGLIRVYGRCVPNACDWGNRRYRRINSGLLASWRQSGIGHKVVLLERAGVNRVKAIVKYLYCDGRVDKTSIEYFKKVPIIQVVDRRDKFVGSWVSSNPNTRMLTKGRIYKQGRGIYVHLWGKCHPNDCDWGSIGARVNVNRLNIIWNKGFVRRVMIIKGLNYYNGKYHKLRIKTTNYYNDSRGVRRTVEYMNRVN